MKTTKSFLAVSIALALSGCGGGGSGSSSSPSFLTTIPVEAESDFDNLGISIPREGSVTQSTNIDASNVTENQIHITISGNEDAPAYQLSYDADADGTAEDTIDTSLLSSRDFSAHIDNVLALPVDRVRIGTNGGIGFDTDGDGTDDGNVHIYLYTDYDATDDTDYVAGGVWVYLPHNYSAADPYSLGAFVDGTNEFDMSLASGSATYIGRMTGIYSEITSDSTNVQYAFSDVELDANFDTDTVSGMLTNFELSYTGVAADYQSTLTGSINLNDATISTSDGGFFTGDLSGIVEGVNVTGNYGGLFYSGTGNTPSRVAGTIGGSGEDDDGNSYDFIGAFGGYPE